MSKHSRDLAAILLLTLLAVGATHRGFGEDTASSVVLGFSGNVEVCSKGSSSGCRKVSLMRLLYPGDVLKLSEHSTVTIKFVRDGHREAASGPGKLTVGADSCKGEGTQVRRLPGHGKLLALRDKKCIGDHLGVAFTDRPSVPKIVSFPEETIDGNLAKPKPVPAPQPRPTPTPAPERGRREKPPAVIGGARKDAPKSMPELSPTPTEARPEPTPSLPAPDPPKREIFCSLYPTFTWRAGAGEVRFLLYEGEEPRDLSGAQAKVPCWNVKIAENRVTYPPDAPVLRWGGSYYWRVVSTAPTGSLIASGSFRLPRSEEAARQLCDARSREREFLKKKDLESLVEVVLLYFDNGYYEESLPLLRTLVTVRDDPAVHYLLAKVYYAQGNRAQGDWEKQQIERLGGDKETYALP